MDKSSVYRSTQKKSYTLRSMDVISCQWFLMYFDCTKYNEINMYFAIFKNMLITEYGINHVHNLCTAPYKSIGIYQWLLLEIAEGSFPVILCNFSINCVLRNWTMRKSLLPMYKTIQNQSILLFSIKGFVVISLKILD